jgi:hypothetical protein
MNAIRPACKKSAMQNGGMKIAAICSGNFQGFMRFPQIRRWNFFSIGGQRRIAPPRSRRRSGATLEDVAG